MTGRRIDRCRLTSFAALKTVVPPLDDLVGRTVDGVERRGKFVCVDAQGLWLVAHLARGGWIRWYEALPATALKPGRSPIALRVGLDDGAGFDVTEMGTEKRLALWVVDDPGAVVPVAELGVDPLSPEFTVERLGGPPRLGLVHPEDRPDHPVADRRGGQRLLRRGPAPGPAVAVQELGPPEPRRGGPPPRRRHRRAVRGRGAVLGRRAVRAQGGQEAGHGRARPDRPGLPDLWGHHPPRCRSPPSPSSTAPPARPGGSPWPTGGCPSCSSRRPQWGP